MSTPRPPARPEEPAPPRATSSGIPLDLVYEPAPKPAGYDARVGRPGEPPFTRGVQAHDVPGPPVDHAPVRGLLDRRGVATAATAPCSRGGTSGLSVAFDLPTQIGYDPDHALSAGEVGRAGVSIATLDDVETLFDGDPARPRLRLDDDQLDGGRCSSRFLVAVAKRRGDRPAARSRARSRTTCSRSSPRAAPTACPCGRRMRLVTDVIAYTSERLPKWNPISISGYHIREAGSTAVQEVAFTLADGIAYVEAAVRRGLRRRRLRAAALLLLQRAQPPLRGGREVPRGPPHLGPHDEGALRREGPARASRCASTRRPRAARSRRGRPT